MIRPLLLFFSLVLVFSCKTSKGTKNGKTAFESKQYSVAAVLLESEYNNEKDKSKKAELAYLLGESYRNNNENRPASKWYDKAVELDYGPKALYEMAYVLKKLERYNLAARYFAEIIKTSERKTEIREEIRKCKEAEKLKNLLVNTDYDINLMDFNTNASEYSPFLLSSNELIFTSDENDNKRGAYKWTGRGFSDIKLYNLSSGLSTSFSDRINTKENEGSATFNKNRTRVFFTRCFDEDRDHYCKILMSDKEEKSWSEPIAVFPMDPTVNYRDPVLIENDSVLIFSCDDPKGYGGTDLYYSVLETDSWSVPDLMPPSINTIGDERFPTSNADTLYFSSDYLLGIGGLDLFKTYLRSDNSWAQPENLGVPFNSSDDDFGFIISPYKRDFVAIEGYFTSDRSGQAKDDIYHFMKHSDKKLEIVQIEEKEEEIEDEKEIITVLSLKVKEQSYAVIDDPNSLLLGTKPVQNASVLVELNGEKQSLLTDNKGNILIPVDPDLHYELLVGKRDYLNTKGIFTFEKIDIDIEEGLKTFNKEMIIDRIFHNVEIVLDNIYYDFNESFIREDAQPALNDLYEVLVNNPALNIQLSSHTDCQGEEDYNENLSQRRAEAAIEYIISKGINAQRISAVGYGENHLYIDCECLECTEDEHQLNRRTTFKIL